MNFDKEMQLNQELTLKFGRDRTEENLRNLIMSELLTPIEDFGNVMTLVEKNLDIIHDKRILFVAAYLHAGWALGENPFLKILNDEISCVDDQTKAIIWYLNAYQLIWKGDGANSNDLRRQYLWKSVRYSTGMYFALNRYDLSSLESGSTAKMLRREAKANVKEILTLDELRAKPIDYWIDIQTWVDEFILGTCMTERNYKERYGVI